MLSKEEIERLHTEHTGWKNCPDSIYTLAIAIEAAVIEAEHNRLLTGSGEPVAWRTFDGEGGYDFRTYDDNENYAAEWAKRNPKHVGWVEPLYTANQMAAAVLRERERCAQVVDKYAKANMESDIMVDAFTHCAAAIRKGDSHAE